MKRGTARSASVGLLTALAVLLTACGEESGDQAATGESEGLSADQGGGDDAPDVPPECAEAYPMAFGPADLADVSLLPEDWPDPPVDATLCVTTSGVGGGSESAEYATEATEEAVEEGYLEALAAYGATRAVDGMGDPVVQATVEGTYVEVQMDPGAFRLVVTDGG